LIERSVQRLTLWRRLSRGAGECEGRGCDHCDESYSHAVLLQRWHWAGECLFA
jgi:hypothetical protein